MPEPPAIRHRVYIAASVERIYETLATGKGWDGWFTQGTVVTAKPGGKIELRWRDFGLDHCDLDDGGPVIVAEPNRRFAFEWSPAGHSTRVEFTLTSFGQGTVVELLETGYLGSDLVTLVQCAVGWGEALTLLKVYLEHGIVYGQIPN
jgi:uncharacterized protein YndB with AHSA1/START domain